jgi:hypothetical protein
MVVGALVFAVVAVVCIVAGFVALQRRREYEQSDGDDPMSDAEFRRIEGFDE